MPTVSGINSRRDTLKEAVDKSLDGVRLVGSKSLNLVDSTEQRQPQRPRQAMQQPAASEAPVVQEQQQEPVQQVQEQDPMTLTPQQGSDRGAVTASSVLDRIANPAVQAQPKSSLLAAPVSGDDSRQQAASGYIEADRNPNLYDIQMTTPPVQPVPDIGQIRKARNVPSQRPTLESTVDMALGTGGFGLPPAQPRADAGATQETVQPRSEEADESVMAENADDRFDDNLVEEGPSEATTPVARLIDVPGSSFYEGQKLHKKAAERSVADKAYQGNGFADKAISHESVFPDAVMVGYENILEIVRVPGNMFLNVLADVTGLELTPEQAVHPESMNAIVEAVNSAAKTSRPIWVVATKSPDPDHYSSQTRRLMIKNEGRGVTIHPSQTKVYTMDFDGDDVSIQFTADPNMFSNPMELMIGLDGKAMIDSDQVPKPRFASSLQDYRDRMTPYVLTSYESVIDKSKIVEAMYYFTYPEQINDGRDPWVDFVRALHAEASKYSDRNMAMAGMLNDVYRTLTVFNRAKIADDNAENLPLYSSGIVESPADGWVALVIDEVAAGRVPMNVYDFQNGYHKAMADAKGQNVPFRLNQDLMKLLKTSKSTFAGDKELAELYQLSCDAGFAMWLNGQVELGGKAINYTERIRDYVLHHTGMPSKYRSKKGYIDAPRWLSSFKTSYNYIVGMMDAVGVTVDMGLDIDGREVRNHQIESDRLLDFVTPLVKVYGSDYTLEKLFPGEFKFIAPDGGPHMKEGKLWRRYKRYTLEKLSQTNGIKSIYNVLKEKRIGKCNASDVLYAVADHRRSASSKFHQVYTEMLEQHTSAFRFIEEANRNRFRNWESYVESVSGMIHLSGPGMFSYYGMGDLFTFLNTEYGTKLREAAAKGWKELGGVHTTMVFNYRISAIERINADISRIMYSERIPNIARLNHLRQRLSDEIDILASSSNLWEVIGKELRGDTSAYQRLLETRGKVLGKWTDARDVYWKHPKFGHNSLIDVIKDMDVPLDVKQKVAADVVRVSLDSEDAMKDYDFDYQLQIGPKPEYTSVSTMSYHEDPAILDAVQKSTNRLKSFLKKNVEDLEKSVKTVRAMSVPGALERHLNRLATDPQAYLRIDDYLFVDAVNSGMEPTTKSDEKGKTEDPVNVFYKAMKMQRGGLDNVMYRLDDSIVGRVGSSDVSRLDLFKALSDPEFSLELYDGGHMGELSRQSLCGGMSEDDLWGFFERNPRLINMLKQHVATSSGTDTYVVTEGSVTDAMVSVDPAKVLKNQVKSFLFDDSMFASMVSLFVPKEKKTASMVREKTKRVVNSLTSLFIGLAKIELIDKRPIDVESDLLAPLGVTADRLVSLGMEKRTAEDYYDDLIFYSRKFMLKAERVIEDGGFFNDARRVHAENVALEMDGASARAALDVRQFMRAGKIAMSTRVEGSITARNQAAALYFTAAKDRYMTVDELMTPAELAPLEGCMTNGGPLSAENLHDLVESVKPDPLVVEVPEGYEVPDRFLTDEGTNISSTAVFCLHHRSNEAEAGNLQLKKTGRQERDPSVPPQDDVTSSVTRSERYMHDWKRNRALIDDAFNSGGIFAARLAYAKILQKADNAAGYSSMDLGNYMSIAANVIQEVDGELGSSYKIVTMSQISDAVRKGLDPTNMINGTPQEVMDASVRIVEDIPGTVVEADLDRDFAVAPFLRMPVTSDGSFRPSKKASMSFKDKNYKMQLTFANSETFTVPWSGEIVEKGSLGKAPTKKWLKNTHNDMAAKSVYEVYSAWDTEYRVIGRVGGGFSDIKSDYPGLASVILIEPGATQVDIDNALKLAYGRGMTVAFRDLDILGDKAEVFEEDVKYAPFSSELVMLPFFEMRMSGWSLSPAMAPASFQRDPGWLQVVVEDRDNFYNIGDGQYLADHRLAESMKVERSGVEEIPLDDMFYNTIQRYPDQIDRFELAAREEIEATIINWRDEGPVIDLGLPEAGRYEQRADESLRVQLEEYRMAFASSDKNGIVEYGSPDRIVGWMKCFVKGYSNPVWAPIIPFPTGSTQTVPTRFKISGDIADDGLSLSVPWELDMPLYGQYLKALDGNGASGKGGVVIDRTTDLGALEMGKRISFMVSRSSFDSRIEPAERRLRTMKSMTYLMSDPPYGYNFASHESAFPDNPEIRDTLQKERIPIHRWKSLYETMGRFCTEPDVDALLRKLVGEALKTGTTNPSDMLASMYEGAYSFMEWDMNFYFEPTDEFQNAWMHFMSMMNSVVPPSLDAFDPNKHIFKPVADINDPDYGSLLMRVPYPSKSGVRYKWEIVYAELTKFTDDSTPLHKVGVNKSRRTMEQLTAAAMSGKMPAGKDFRDYMRHTLMASSQPVLNPGTIEVDYSRYSRKDR